MQQLFGTTAIFFISPNGAASGVRCLNASRDVKSPAFPARPLMDRIPMKHDPSPATLDATGTHREIRQPAAKHYRFDR